MADVISYGGLNGIPWPFRQGHCPVESAKTLSVADLLVGSTHVLLEQMDSCRSPKPQGFSLNSRWASNVT